MEAITNEQIVKNFKRRHLRPAAESAVMKEEVYRVFKTYCAAQGYVPPLGKGWLFRLLKQVGFDVTHQRRMVDGRRRYIIRGWRIV